MGVRKTHKSHARCAFFAPSKSLFLGYLGRIAGAFTAQALQHESAAQGEAGNRQQRKNRGCLGMDALQIRGESRHSKKNSANIEPHRSVYPPLVNRAQPKLQDERQQAYGGKHDDRKRTTQADPVGVNHHQRKDAA